MVRTANWLKNILTGKTATSERNYGVTSWQSTGEAKITNDALDTFPDFRNMLVCKGDFLQGVKGRFDLAIKKMPLTLKDGVEEVSAQAGKQINDGLNGTAWEDTSKAVTDVVLQTRTFENKGLIYIGMEIPKEIADLGDDIEKQLTEVDATYAKEAKKLFQQTWFQAVGEHYGLEKKSISAETMKRNFTAMFPVSQHRLEKNVVEESTDKTRVIITAAGDAKVSPHFMSARGLTGAREHILSLRDFAQDLFIRKDASTERLEQEDERTADFIINRGRVFLETDRPGNKVRLDNY